MPSQGPRVAGLLGREHAVDLFARHELAHERYFDMPVAPGEISRDQDPQAGRVEVSEGTIPSGLKLVDSKVSTTGVVIGTYEPAGELVTGTFAPD